MENGHSGRSVLFSCDSRMPGFSNGDDVRSRNNVGNNSLSVEMIGDDDDDGSNAIVVGSSDGEYSGLCELGDNDSWLPCKKIGRSLKTVCWPADAGWTTVRGRHLRRLTLVFVPSLPLMVVAVAAAVQLSIRYLNLIRII
jgi:hypothetical protein